MDSLSIGGQCCTVAIGQVIDDNGDDDWLTAPLSLRQRIVQVPDQIPFDASATCDRCNSVQPNGSRVVGDLCHLRSKCASFSGCCLSDFCCPIRVDVPLGTCVWITNVCASSNYTNRGLCLVWLYAFNLYQSREQNENSKEKKAFCKWELARNGMFIYR